MAADPGDRLQQLEEFLDSEAVGEDALTLSELDGFLAGVIVSPELILPAEWLPVIWGETDPLFENAQQARAVFDLIMAHYNATVSDLDRSRYRPLYEVGPDDSPTWELWVAGFWEAMLLRSKAWLALTEYGDNELQAAVFSLSRLCELATARPDELQPLEIDEELEELAPGLIPYAVQMLHAAKLKQAGQAAGPLCGAAVKVGRNQPCPCGSGRKFKHCCLR